MKFSAKLNKNSPFPVKSLKFAKSSFLVPPTEQFLCVFVLPRFAAHDNRIQGSLNFWWKVEKSWLYLWSTNAVPWLERSEISAALQKSNSLCNICFIWRNSSSKLSCCHGDRDICSWSLLLTLQVMVNLHAQPYTRSICDSKSFDLENYVKKNPLSGQKSIMFLARNQEYCIFDTSSNTQDLFAIERALSMKLCSETSNLRPQIQ